MTAPLTGTEICIAANHGQMGGGEVMLLALADALIALGCAVSIVAPPGEGGILDRATEHGIPAEALGNGSAVSYATALRRWKSSHPETLLWCNGLRPATATAGMGRRVVHLHQLPRGVHRLLTRWARLRSEMTIVPSDFVARRVRGSVALGNWVHQPARPPDSAEPHTPAHRARARAVEPGRLRVGFLGRPTMAKGIGVLVEALSRYGEAGPRPTLVIAGAPRFSSRADRRTVAAALAAYEGEVTTLGWTEPRDLFGQIDVLVVPSVEPESFGLAAAEAMAGRVPLIVSNAGALPEVVGPDYPWIARAGDALDLTEVLALAASGLPQQGVVESARGRWEAEWSPEAGRRRLTRILAMLGYGPADGKRRDMWT